MRRISGRYGQLKNGHLPDRPVFAMDRAKPPGGTESDMRFSSYVEKMGGGDTAAVHDAWSVHGKARQRQRAGEDITGTCGIDRVDGNTWNKNFTRTVIDKRAI